MSTSFNDFTIKVHEDAFNKIIRSFRAQAPMIFNYATPDLITSINNAAAENPDSLKRFLCDDGPIKRNADRTNPVPVAALFTATPYLPIPGYDGNRGLSYIVQIADIKFDFHSNNKIDLPPELANRFTQQTIGFQLKLCVGLACPEKEKLEKFIDELPPPEPFDPGKFGKRFQKFEPPKPGDFPTDPFPTANIDCFCLNVYALARINRRQFRAEPTDDPVEFLSLEVRAVEIADITPVELENSLECLIYMVLNFGVLPKLRMLVSDIVMVRGPFAIRMTPLNPNIPFNPSVEKDELRLFLSIGLS